MPEICDDILLLPVGNYSLYFFLSVGSNSIEGHSYKDSDIHNILQLLEIWRRGVRYENDPLLYLDRTLGIKQLLNEESCNVVECEQLAMSFSYTKMY